MLCKRDKKLRQPAEYAKVGKTGWWADLVQKLKQRQVTDVYILAGAHTNECIQESTHYLLDRKDFFLEHGFKVHFAMDQTPDEDLIMMTKVKILATTGEGSKGGFAKLLSMIVKASGGTVLAIKKQ